MKKLLTSKRCLGVSNLQAFVFRITGLSNKTMIEVSKENQKIIK